jgi:hypothetical protein
VVQGGAALSSLICAAAAPPTFRKRAADAPPHKSGQEFATLSLPLPRGELQPGQSYSLPMWVRAAAVGTHVLHFVFCYEAVSPHRLLKQRLCPLSAQLSVEPSLQLRHFLRPAHACASQESYVLGLSARNAARAGLRLLPTQVSCVSSAWQMTMLTAAEQRPELLAPGEELSLYLALKRRPATPSPGPPAGGGDGSYGDDDGDGVVHSELSFAGHATLDSRATPYTSFLLRDGAPSTTAASLGETRKVSEQRPPAPVQRHSKQSTEKVVPERVAVLFHFRTDDGTVTGQLHVTGLPLQELAPPPPNELSSPKPRSAPLNDGAKGGDPTAWADAARDDMQLWPECARKLSHDFRMSPLCEVDVKLHVRNTSRSTHLAFDFEALGSGASQKPDPAAAPVPMGGATANVDSATPPAAGDAPSPFAGVPSVCASGRCAWVGLTQLRHKWLKPGEKVVLPLRAAVLGIGVCMVDGYRVALCDWRADADAPEQPFSPQVACAAPVVAAVSVTSATP